MPLTNFPNGVSSFGMPMIGSGPIFTTGNIFFVDSGATNASDSTDQGTEPLFPFATIDYAIGRCTASNGDYIIVMPGHTENITGIIALDVAGVTVIGLGVGFTRPQIVHTGTGGRVEITASSCRWSNIIHIASVASVVSAITVSGPGTASATEHCQIDNCRFTFELAGTDLWVDTVALGDGGTNSADYITIRDNWFQAETVDGAGSALLIDDCQFIDIIGNRFSGDYNNPVIMCDAGSSVCLDFYIVDNVIENRDDGTTNIFQMDNAATGVIIRNTFSSPLADTEIHFDQGICRMSENYSSDDADNVSGGLAPSATAT